MDAGRRHDAAELETKTLLFTSVVVARVLALSHTSFSEPQLLQDNLKGGQLMPPHTVWNPEFKWEKNVYICTIYLKS